MKHFARTLLLVASPLAAQLESGGLVSDALPHPGTVTSFSLGTVGSLFSASVANSTTTPALSLNLATQAANCVIAGPTTGSAAVPTCRALVAADVPSLSGTYLPLAGGTMTGALLFTDNAYDIGASGATRPRTLYLGTSIISPSAWFIPTAQYPQFSLRNTAWGTGPTDGLHIYQGEDGVVYFIAGEGDGGDSWRNHFKLNPTTHQLILGAQTQPLNLYQLSYISNANTAAGLTNQNWMITQYARTADDADLNRNFQLSTIYGIGGVAAKGRAHVLGADLVIAGNATATAEHAAFVSLQEYDIGTGYTQTTGPAGVGWNASWEILGPISVQAGRLNGQVQVLNNHYNGAPSMSPAGAFWAVTNPGHGDAIHIAADTFPSQVGYGCVGFSHHGGSDDTGWTTCLQIGGSGSPWDEAKSLIGTGIDITDYATRGIYIHSPTGTPTASIQTDGKVIVGGLLTGANIGGSGSIPAVSNTTANSCGTSAATIATGSTDVTGAITVGATSGTSCTMTFTTAAPTRRQCAVWDETTAVLTRSIYTDTTHSNFVGVFTAGDVVSYVCAVY